VRSHPDCLTGLDHLSGLYGRWATLTGAVRAGTSVLDETHDPEHRLDTEAFIEAMHRRGKAQAEEAARLLQPFLPADASPRVLDVGGGSGVFAMALCRAVPGLTAVVLDQPRVAPLARRYVRDAGLEERVAVREGDLTADSLADDAGGFHCVLVSAIVHMLGPDEIRDLLVRCARACAPGGVVAVKDFLMEPERTSPAFGAVFALNMLVNTPRGDTYTETELRRWLEEAGLDHAERVPSAVSEADLLVARKP
jgi:predicted O-methyltransferase YrrM